jgi:hypothetical protein
VSGIAIPILMLFGIVTITNAGYACAGTSQVDLISLTAMGGSLVWPSSVGIGTRSGG